MEYTFKTKLPVLLLSLFVFSATAVFAQANKIVGEWTLLLLKENGKDVPLYVGKNSSNLVRIRFLTKNSFGLSSACNGISGIYAITGKDNFKFTAMRTQLMMCSQPSMEIERSLSSTLSKITQYKIKNGMITFQDKNRMNTVVFTNAQYDNSPANKAENIPSGYWKNFNACNIAFAAPPTLKNAKATGTNSCVAELKDENIVVFIDYGMLQMETLKSDLVQDYREESIIINNKKLPLVTYVVGGRPPYGDPHKKYKVARLTMRAGTLKNAYGDTPTYLNMTIIIESEKDLEIARQILKTIEFNRRLNQ